MKKYILFIAILISCFTAHAQKRLVATAAYMPSHTTGMDTLTDTVCYTYGGNRYTTPNNLRNFDTAARMFLDQGTWKVKNYDIQTFDANDRILTDGRVDRNNSGNWEYGIQQAFTYDATGKLVTDTVYIYAISAGYWYAIEYTNYTYNAANQVVSETIIDWNEITNTWGKDERILYHYNAAGYLIVKEYQVWPYMGSAFITMDSTKYTYNANNLCIRIDILTWKDTYWSDYSTQVFAYNGNGDVVAQYDLSAADTLSSLLTYYNATNDTTATTYRAKRTTWLMGDSTIYTWNSDGNPDTESQMRWDEFTASYRRAGFYKCYYEPFTPNSVTNVSKAAAQLQLHPVPATNTLYLQTQDKEQQHYTVTITDMQGKQVLRNTYIGNTTRQLDISTLPAGMYNITLLSNKGAVQHSKFTVVR